MNEQQESNVVPEVGMLSGGLKQVDRLLLLGGSAALMVLMVVAGWLEPSSAGYGTHQRLGLPPCSMKALWGLPCPTCGMTTSWSHMARLQLVAAWNCNPGGLLLWWLAASSALWMFLSGCLGRWYPRPFPAIGWALVATPIGLITLAVWLDRLFESL